MKHRRKKVPISNRTPDWQHRPPPVFRDVKPGHFPVTLYNEDGSEWITLDFPASTIERLEAVAKKHRKTFCETIHTALVSGITERMKKERGFE